MSRTVPERIRWAVKTLDIKSSDRLLEIGGGPGVAASIICERLDSERDSLTTSMSPLGGSGSRRSTSRATEELAHVSDALAPRGTLFLFYETPTAERAREAAGRVAEALRTNGFTEPDVRTRAPNLICSVTRPS
jgi:hypothetical protein